MITVRACLSPGIAILLMFLLLPGTAARAQSAMTERFDQNIKLDITGRGLVKIENGVLSTRNAYAGFGDPEAKDYEVSFKTRTPGNEQQVQIWAGFRASSRNDRYIIGLRGGIENDLYLARLGYMGTDDHLALRHLEFPLTPGTWYKMKIQVAGNRIRVFMNEEEKPRIDVKDPYTEFSPKGKVILGGSWIQTEFDDLSVKALPADFFKAEKVNEYALKTVDKAQKREKDRQGYKPLEVKQVADGRTKISLNGKWLFKPGYELSNTEEAISPETADQNWHVMTVPQFWNPNREWLHGEKYNTASKGVADNYYQKEIERCEGYTFDYKRTDVGYYRQWLELPQGITGKNLELTFDAVSKVGEVFVNGKRASQPHIGMFGEFKVDVTPFLKAGKNLVVVKVSRDYVKDIKDADKVTDVAVTVPVTNKMLKDLAHGFYNDDPAGIWQPVALVISDPLRITDVFIKPNLTGADFEVTIKNNTTFKKEFSLSTSILADTALSGQGHSVLADQSLAGQTHKTDKALFSGGGLKGVSLNAGEEKTFSFSTSGLKPNLWSPATPNLYNFSFIINSAKKESDRLTIRSGFKTFAAKGDYFYLNGKPYWLRGGNHTPMSLAPNDTALANVFNKLMHDGNIAVTRTHTAPYNELWMSSSDQHGVGVSYEGGWPWLMINSSMPDSKLIELWKNEYFDLIRKYRNHPSLLFWTVNNEMKFYDNDPDIERAKLKMKLISAVVKRMRELDPTRPVSFDSNYTRKEKKFGKAFYDTIDDGDIDDQHWYLNWYHGSVFSEFNGEWQQRFKNPGRPLISQEFSTGYPSETGHPTRFYTYVHQNPSSLVGNYAYEYENPEYFLKAQAFITRESAEAVRRTNEKAAGIMHFAALTWFKNIYQADKIAPHFTYGQMKKALQPVLVSAELWGRHFYAGTDLPVRIYVVNDRESGTDLPETELQWSVQDQDGKVLSAGKEVIPAVAYYGRKWITPRISIPAQLPASANQNLGANEALAANEFPAVRPGTRVNAKLVLRLLEKGKVISENDYDILLADKNWLNSKDLQHKNIVITDPLNKIIPLADLTGLKYQKAVDLALAMKSKPDVLVISGLDSASTSVADVLRIRTFVKNGGKLLLLNPGRLAVSLFPEQIRGMIKEKGEIASMEIPESVVFTGLEPLDLRYFNNDKRENPAVISGAYQVNRAVGTVPLAAFTKVHGYLEGNIYERSKSLDAIRGFPVVRIKDKGEVILSEFLLEKGTTDPVAARLFINLLLDLARPGLYVLKLSTPAEPL